MPRAAPGRVDVAVGILAGVSASTAALSSVEYVPSPDKSS